MRILKYLLFSALVLSSSVQAKEVPIWLYALNTVKIDFVISSVEGKPQYYVFKTGEIRDLTDVLAKMTSESPITWDSSQDGIVVREKINEKMFNIKVKDKTYKLVFSAQRNISGRTVEVIEIYNESNVKLFNVTNKTIYLGDGYTVVAAVSQY